MGSRMDKYKKEVSQVPKRSEKNQELYKQIYNAYDEFENLVVPSNAREITMSELKKEITSREAYREKKVYDDIADKVTYEKPIQKEKKVVQEDNKVYDIRELLSKAISNQDETKENMDKLSSGDYLKKIKVDSHKTNIEQVKEIYEDTLEEEMEEDESLLKTANLSLEILSDLKSDNDQTIVEAPIKSSELPDDAKDSDFYSTQFKFSKRDFEKKKDEDKVITKNEEDDEDDEDDEEFGTDKGGFKRFIKVLLLVFGILLIIILLLYIFKIFNRV